MYLSLLYFHLFIDKNNFNSGSILKTYRKFSSPTGDLFILTKVQVTLGAYKLRSRLVVSPWCWFQARDLNMLFQTDGRLRLPSLIWEVAPSIVAWISSIRPRPNNLGSTANICNSPMST